MSNSNKISNDEFGNTRMGKTENCEEYFEDVSSEELELQAFEEAEINELQAEFDEDEFER